MGEMVILLIAMVMYVFISLILFKIVLKQT